MLLQVCGQIFILNSKPVVACPRLKLCCGIILSICVGNGARLIGYNLSFR